LRRLKKNDGNKRGEGEIMKGSEWGNWISLKWWIEGTHPFFITLEHHLTLLEEKKEAKT
jgi:hypothetical protein